MDLGKMKVAQIATLLAGNELPLHSIEMLQADPRLSVRRLADKWKSQELRREKERLRLNDLYQYEAALYNKGFERVAGIDEAGRGPLAGPVVVAAVILPQFAKLDGLNDSKQLSAMQREKLYTQIHQLAISISWQVVPVEIIDEVNIYQATVHGMYQSVNTLSPSAQAILIDAVKLPELAAPWQAIIGGDALSASIAAASVIAKVERDRIMNRLHEQYPEYGFNKHKGYGTKEHLQAIAEFGPCPAHRRSFEPVKSRGEGLFGA